MLLIRRFEEKSKQAFTQGKIKGFCHLYNGQEAVAVGPESMGFDQEFFCLSICGGTYGNFKKSHAGIKTVPSLRDSGPSRGAVPSTTLRFVLG